MLWILFPETEINVLYFSIIAVVFLQFISGDLMIIYVRKVIQKKFQMNGNF